MKITFLFSVVLSLLALVMATPAKQQLQPRVITYNIRYAASPPSRGEKPWSERRPRLLAQLNMLSRYADNTFICLQEALDQQVQDVLGGLSSFGGAKWAYLGVGRDDGHKAGEYSPIFYRPDVWELLSSEYVWLSPTPNKPSKGWDAGSIRILTIGIFKDRATEKHVIMMNTHLDNQGVVSRRESVGILLEKAKKHLDALQGKNPGLILTMDFNSETRDEPYKILTGSATPFADSHDLAKQRYGNQITFTGFEGQSGPRIDFVFVGPKAAQPWQVLEYGVEPNRFDDGVYLSDHRAVFVDLVSNGAAS